ncbi:hypothetical protein RBH29_15760 [Herbivorax sp. ANBcel31]|uniref:hypothetical protein n=1 Tax=Herbivorax sp. ANBcel31 TaxID=3069754 RepID=UPI0027AFE894|nr:hypothetical protein [Herbivorax sp. ANBcel31]MDQ2087887.1 hypothetical protein [Herbivorax sp. ANBcel31]
MSNASESEINSMMETVEDMQNTLEHNGFYIIDAVKNDFLTKLLMKINRLKTNIKKKPYIIPDTIAAKKLHRGFR